MADWFQIPMAVPGGRFGIVIRNDVDPTGTNNSQDNSSSSSSNSQHSSNSNSNFNKRNELPFHSRRSPILCRNACVASSQPLASSIGLELLLRHRCGGDKNKNNSNNKLVANAADVAVAVAAALAVTEPCSTGVGGDMFCLYYDNQTKQVSCINGSGKSPKTLSWQYIQEKYPATEIAVAAAAAAASKATAAEEADAVEEAKRQGKDAEDHDDESGRFDHHRKWIDATQYQMSALAVTVPGAVRGWNDLLERHGSGNYTMAELLEPAAKLAEEGFPVAPITAHHWAEGLENQIRPWHVRSDDDDDDDERPIPLTINGKDAPRAGDVMTNPDLARVLRAIGQQGADEGFYQGPTAQAMVATVQRLGGCLTLEDLQDHASDFPQPICTEYRGCRLWQVPPNGQGIAGLIALAGLRHLEQPDVGLIEPLSPSSIGSADAYHAMMEMMRLGFADARAHIADPAFMNVDPQTFLLDPERINTRAAKLFDPQRAVIQGAPDASSCTVSFQVVDTAGNAISFVNSNYMGFGTGIVPDNCGFTMQNRGAGFSLQPDHPNVVAGDKRPYHTIIPGMLTYADETNDLYATISNMGGNMQPQGHVQLTVNMLAGGMDPQTAIDQPRFCILDGTQHGKVFFEEGMDIDVLHELKRRGHDMRVNVRGHERSMFGRAQITQRDRATGVLWAGSDGRADGCAMGF